AGLAGPRTPQLEGGEGLELLSRRLGLLLGVVAPFEPSVGAARERLAAACTQHPLALLVDDAGHSEDWLEAMLHAIVRDPAWKRRPLLGVAGTAPAVGAPERVERPPPPPAMGKAELAAALGARPGGLGRETDGRPREMEQALRDLAERGLLARRRGRWELDVLRAGPDFGGCVPRASARAAREALLDLPGARLAEIGFAAVVWPQIEA